jgi:hypothetical protein
MLVNAKLLSLITFWDDQRAPFQRSASAPPWSPPTVMQLIRDKHDTAIKLAPPPDPTVMPRQRDPSHCSAMVAAPLDSGPCLAEKTDPTAMQKRLDRHDTPASEPDLPPLVGTRFTLH